MRFIALLPAYRFIPVETVQAVVALQAELLHRGDSIKICFANGFNAAHARNELLKFAATREADYVINIDTDHVFDVGQLDALVERLQEHDLEMLSAGYLTRGAGKEFAHGRYQEDRSFRKIKKSDVSGLVDCDVLGFGFLLMRMDFVRKMVERFADDMFVLDCVNNTTEDVYFCRQAQSIGTRICFDADIIVGHLTTVVNQ